MGLLTSFYITSSLKAWKLASNVYEDNQGGLSRLCFPAHVYETIFKIMGYYILVKRQKGLSLI